jgi:hypothetical protein
VKKEAYRLDMGFCMFVLWNLTGYLPLRRIFVTQKAGAEDVWRTDFSNVNGRDWALHKKTQAPLGHSRHSYSGSDV